MPAVSRGFGLAPLFCLISTLLFILLGREEEVKHPSPGSVVLAGQSRAPPAVTALHGFWSGARERFPVRLFRLSAHAAERCKKLGLEAVQRWALWRGSEGPFEGSGAASGY